MLPERSLYPTMQRVQFGRGSAARSRAHTLRKSTSLCCPKTSDHTFVTVHCRLTYVGCPMSWNLVEPFVIPPDI